MTKNYRPQLLHMLFHGNVMVFLCDLSLCVFCLFSWLVLSLLKNIWGNVTWGPPMSGLKMITLCSFLTFLVSHLQLLLLYVCMYGIYAYICIYACIVQFIFSLSFYEFSVCLNSNLHGLSHCRFSTLLASYASKSLFLPL